MNPTTPQILRAFGAIALEFVVVLGMAFLIKAMFPPWVLKTAALAYLAYGLMAMVPATRAAAAYGYPRYGYVASFAMGLTGLLGAWIILTWL